jgi:hypothetical protein
MQPVYDLKNNPNLLYDLASGRINNNNKTLRLLAGADSIHDFNDRGIRVPINTWNTVFSSLLQNLNALSNTGVTNLTDWTQWMSSNKIPAGAIEAKTVSYFESEYPGYLSGITVNLTYRTVINTILQNFEANGKNINNAILQANIDLCGDADILEIDMATNENWNTSYSQDDKKLIGLFFLNFYFPPKQNSADNTSNPSYITFDAGSNIPSKIFGLLDQVINLVTPLNIADSATEGTHLATDKNQKRAGVKNKYVFPVNTLPGQPEGYIYKSNIYTMSNDLKLYITKPPGEYNETNKYNFTVIVEQGQTLCPLILFTNGGQTYKSGPGVEYLSEVMNGNQTAKPSTGVIAPINMNCPNVNIANKQNALYLDVKRSGDWEQCLAALTVNKLMPGTTQSGRVILSTIDRLCALFSRCIGQNTLYHYGTQLILYRYKTGELSQADLDKIANELTDQANAEQSNAVQAIAQIDQEFGVFAQFNDNVKVSINGFNATTQLKPFINEIAKLLLYASLEKYKDIKQQFVSTQNPKQFLSSLKELTGEYITYKKITDFINTIRMFTSSIQTGVNTMILPKGRFCYYDSALLIGIHNSLLEINTFNPQGRVTKTLSNFNYKTRLEDTGLFSNLNKISTELDSISKPTLDSALQIQLTQLNQSITMAQVNQIEEVALDAAQIGNQIQMITNVQLLLQTLGITQTDMNVLINSITYAPSIVQQEIQSQIQTNQIIAAMSSALLNQSTPIVKRTIYVQAFVTLFSLVQYINTQTDPLYIVYTDTNKAYYTSLQLLLKAVIDTIVSPSQGPGRGGGLPQTGGRLDENERNNLLQNLWSTITEEFVSLTAGLNDIAQGLIPDRITPARGQTESQKILEVLSYRQTDVLAKSINNDIIALLQVFFENSWNAIKEVVETDTDIKNNMSEITSVYYTVYVFFACFYGDFLGVNNFLNDCIFFNDYVDLADNIYVTEINRELIDFLIQFNTNKLPLSNKNADVLFIFMCVYGSINYYINIIIKDYISNRKIANINYTNYGYNPSLLDNDEEMVKLFVKVRTTSSYTYNVLRVDNIQAAEMNIFKFLPKVLKTFSIYIFRNGYSDAFTYINQQQNVQLPRTLGGKRTRKKRRKQRKTIKRMKQKKRGKTIKRRKQQKLRKQRKTMKKK